MQRVLVNTAVTLNVAFQVDGADTDPAPDTATVTVTRDDGTVLATAAATPSGTGGFLYTLSAGQNNQLDILTAEWTSALGTLTTTTEVVGGFLFTIAQARALNPLNNTTTYTTQQIIDARTMVETALEDACQVAFVPRYRRESVNGSGSTEVQLSMPRVRSIRSATLDGTALTVSELADIVPSGRIIYTANTWTRGFGNYSISYEHGYDTTPPRVSNAALLLARRYLVDSPVSDRATSLTTEDGTTQFLVTAGVRQAVFDIPEANAVVAQYGLNVCVA
ncbi:MAG TPA: hypothetical protein VNC22_17895 [Sporichthya sp.]|jgi:hypothetical protein|nr:hypothetical protein [Sporichthya sp.]